MPSEALPHGATRAELLDPNGMDGLQTDPRADAGGVLVLNATAQELTARMRERADFLRPGVVLFVGQRGRYQLHMSYAHARWGSFAPEECLEAEAQVSLTIG